MPLFGIRFMQYLNIFTVKKYFEAFSAALYHVKLWVSCHFLESWSHWYLKLQHLLVSQDENTRPSNRSYNGGRLTHTLSKSTFGFLAALCSSRTAFPQASKSDVSTVIWPTGVLTWLSAVLSIIKLMYETLHGHSIAISIVLSLSY